MDMTRWLSRGGDGVEADRARGHASPTARPPSRRSGSRKKWRP